MNNSILSCKFFLLLLYFLILFPSFSFSDKIEGHFFYYTIKSGNSLSQVGNIFYISEKELRLYNSKSTLTHFNVGAHLKIPLKDRKIISYKIRKGDSPYTIEKKFGLDANTLNKILDKSTINNFWVGKTIFIPLSSKKTLVSQIRQKHTSFSSASSVPKSDSFIFYLIKKNDTFYSLSNNFHIPLPQLMQLYGKKTLMKGSFLKIPRSLITHDDASSLLTQTKSDKKVEPFESSKKDFLLFPYEKSENYSPLLPGRIYKTSLKTGKYIYAPLSGTILSIQPLQGFGKAILIQNKAATIVVACEKFRTYYTKPGRKIKKGALLASVSSFPLVYLFKINNKGDVIPFSE
jgi:LysM repeat protein